MPPGSVEARCPECSARITLTALETRPRALATQLVGSELVGGVIGDYRLTGVIGGGGMGIVFDAEPIIGVAGPARVALKILAPDFARDPEFVERFRREADALTRLRHENLIEVYAKGEHVDETRGVTHYYFVMERFEGEDLRRLMMRGAVAPQTAAAIVTKAAAGLSYAHAHGVVHRDIKPANILVSGDPAAGGRVKVVDFGVAQLATLGHTLTSLTRSNLILGTVNYMSPEQRLDASQIDHRADVYALGVVAYELLTGRLPIGAFEAPSELSGKLSRATDRAVLSALRRDPERRPSSILEFAGQLERALSPRSVRPVAIAAAVALTTALGIAGASGLFAKPEATPGVAREKGRQEVPEPVISSEKALREVPEPVIPPEVPKLPIPVEVPELASDAPPIGEDSPAEPAWPFPTDGKPIGGEGRGTGRLPLLKDPEAKSEQLDSKKAPSEKPLTTKRVSSAEAKKNELLDKKKKLKSKPQRAKAEDEEQLGTSVKTGAR